MIENFKNPQKISIFNFSKILGKDMIWKSSHSLKIKSWPWDKVKILVGIIEKFDWEFGWLVKTPEKR